MGLGWGFQGCQWAGCLVSLTIFSMCFGSVSLQSGQGLRGSPSVMEQLWGVVVPPAPGIIQGNLDRTGTKRASVPSAPKCLAIKWECISRLWHSEECALLLHMCWVLSKGAVGWQKKRGKNLSGAFSPFYQQRDLRAFLHLQSLAKM